MVIVSAANKLCHWGEESANGIICSLLFGWLECVEGWKPPGVLLTSHHSLLSWYDSPTTGCKNAGKQRARDHGDRGTRTPAQGTRSDDLTTCLCPWPVQIDGCLQLTTGHSLANLLLHEPYTQYYRSSEIYWRLEHRTEETYNHRNGGTCMKRGHIKLSNQTQPNPSTKQVSECWPFTAKPFLVGITDLGIINL